MRVAHISMFTISLTATLSGGLLLAQDQTKVQEPAPKTSNPPATSEVAKVERSAPAKLVDTAKPAEAMPPPAPAPAPEKEPVGTVTAGTATPNPVGSNGLPITAPQAVRMEPKNAKPGTIVTITGLSLGKDRVEEVYFTDHRFDLKVKVLEQSDTMLKVRIPPFLKPGRQQLLLLTAGEVQMYLEQPFYVQVDTKDDDEKELASAPRKESASAEKGASNGNNSPENK